MIRAAKAADIMAIMGLFRDARARSGRAEEIDEKYAREEILVKAIMYHGHRTALGTHVIVAERDGLLTGIHIGVKSRIGVICKTFFATDLLFYVSRKATPFMAPALVASFEAWAKTDPRVVEIRPGVTNEIADWKVGEKLYERLGYRQCGVFMSKTIERATKGAAA